MQQDRVYAFTTASPIHLSRLSNECEVSSGWDPEATDVQEPVSESFTALWDTGATHCVISAAIVDTFGLIPVGMVEAYHVEGMYMAEVFIVNITLPNDVMFPNLEVTKAEIPGADVLVGMDVIGRGDFAVTNQEGGTKFTFRIPSIQDIDFVADL